MAAVPALRVSAVGFTVKSGWAAAVLLTGPATSPQVADSCRIELSDPALPESRQPHHDGFATARRSGPQLTRLLASVKGFGGKSVGAVMRRYEAAGYQPTGAGIVVGSLIDPSSIANEHIRIHAMEGQLFRGVVHDALVRKRLACSVWRERDLYSTAVEALGRSERDLKAEVAELGRATFGSWRAEQKTAAIAAWMVLARRRE